MENKFGKIVFIARKELKEGFLLRETSTGVMLEQYLDSTHENVDVIAEFEGADFGPNADFETLFEEARKYVGDRKVPIYVDLNRVSR